MARSDGEERTGPVLQEEEEEREEGEKRKEGQERKERKEKEEVATSQQHFKFMVIFVFLVIGSLLTLFHSFGFSFQEDFWLILSGCDKVIIGNWLCFVAHLAFLSY